MENLKQKLVLECEDFNTIDAFRFIDQEGNGAVTPQEIIRFLNNEYGNTIQFDINDLNLFVQRFDKNDRQKLKYSEFCTSFAPLNE